MPSHLSALTLCVRDLDRAFKFYKALGFLPGHHDAEVAFFQLNGSVLALYDAKSYARDYKLKPSALKPGAVCLAQNQRTKKAVDAFLAKAVKVGAKLKTPGADTFWGGYAGVFEDPEGHVWEVAWNPHWKMDAKGNTRMK